MSRGKGVKKEGMLTSLARSIRSGFREVWSNNMGKAGIIIIVFIVAMSIYALAVSPPNIYKIWDDPYAWSDYPQKAPPEWVRYFGYPVAPHRVYVDPGREFSGVLGVGELSKVLPQAENAMGGIYLTIVQGYVEVYQVEYTLEDEAFPQDILAVFKPINNSVILDRGVERTVSAIPYIMVERPDGISMVVAASDKIVAISDLSRLRLNYITFWQDYLAHYASKVPLLANLTDTQAKGLTVKMVFGEPYTVQVIDEETGEVKEHVGFKPVTGTYKIYLIIAYTGATPQAIQQAITAGQVGFEEIKIIVKGNAYGLSGTDNQGRDLWLGILYGFPVALAVGLFAAVTGVILGLVIGVISGYYGGIIDEFIQRLIDVLGNIPLLPILILIGVILQEVKVFHIGPIEWSIGPWDKLFIIIGFLVILGWGGLAIIVRSMTLSIKAEPYVEAAKAIGASNTRIIFRHIIPQIIPYAMASLVFSVPSAIITEAGLSVLGIKHGLPTWGRILADAQANREIAYKMWWWILPPGFMLAITSLAFVLLGLAIETIVEPRLRR